MKQPEIKLFKDLYPWFIDYLCRVNFRNLPNSIVFILSTISSPADSFFIRMREIFYILLKIFSWYKYPD